MGRSWLCSGGEGHCECRRDLPRLFICICIYSCVYICVYIIFTYIRIYPSLLPSICNVGKGWEGRKSRGQQTSLDAVPSSPGVTVA